jgi:hypothetical protein
MSSHRDFLLDLEIRSALNDPLGEESPPSWEALVAQTRGQRPLRRAFRLGLRRRPKQTWILSLATLAAACLAVALVFTVLPGKRTDLLQNAAAAIPAGGPVLHLVYRPTTVEERLIDPATGRVRTVRLKTRDEIWYDPARHLFKEVRQFPGAFPGASDVLWRSRTEAFSADYGRQPLSGRAPGQAISIDVPPEAALFSRYRQALANHEASFNGTGTVQGRPVFFLWIYRCVLEPFPGHPGSSLGCTGGSDSRTIAIDAKTYKPLAVYSGTDTSRPGLPIDEVALVPRAHADLGRPQRTPYPPSLTPGPGGCSCASVGTRAAMTIDPKAARAWLGHPPVGLHPELLGHPLSVARADTLNARGSATRHGVEFVFGSSCKGMPKYGGDYVLVQEAPTPEFFYGTQSVSRAAARIPLDVTSSRFEECEAPKIGFYAAQDRSERIWTTTFRKGGLYIAVSSPGKAAAVAATRQLLKG